MAEVDRSVGALTDAGNRDDPFLSFSLSQKSIVSTVQRAGSGLTNCVKATFGFTNVVGQCVLYLK